MFGFEILAVQTNIPAHPYYSITLCLKHISFTKHFGGTNYLAPARVLFFNLMHRDKNFTNHFGGPNQTARVSVLLHKLVSKTLHAGGKPSNNFRRRDL